MCRRASCLVEGNEAVHDSFSLLRMACEGKMEDFLQLLEDPLAITLTSACNHVTRDLRKDRTLGLEESWARYDMMNKALIEEVPGRVARSILNGGTLVNWPWTITQVRIQMQSIAARARTKEHALASMFDAYDQDARRSGTAFSFERVARWPQWMIAACQLLSYPEELRQTCKLPS